MANLQKKSQIMLREKWHCEFAIAVSRKAGSFSMLNKIANRAYKARADWSNRFYSLWKSTGYRVESQNDKLCLTSNLI